MRFIPHTAGDVSRMLEAVGVSSVDELLCQVPEGLRLRSGLELPPGADEATAARVLSRMASRNHALAGFQGGGCYRHFIPAAVAHIMGRAEFATAYTPYQAEVSQGTLQACFEFQTFVRILTGLEVANASLYDGASALAEAALVALRVGRGRERVLVSEGVHPEYRAVLKNYLRGSGRGRVEEVPLDGGGRTDAAALKAALGGDVAALCMGYPNFLGVVENLESASRAAHECGALAVSATTEALALALLKSPGDCGVDVAVAEGQSLGLPMSYGGPGVGLFATKAERVRQMPGRLVGETVDKDGRRAYVLTLAAREQHIRREKATSNICTNQGLAALAVTVYMALAGPRGLRRLAELNAGRAREVARRLEAEAGRPRVLSAPFFNEFVIDEPEGEGWFQSAVAAGVVPGLRLQQFMPGSAVAKGRLLVTVTECNSDEEVDALVEALAG